PPILNNSGTITENPKPTKPKPVIAIKGLTISTALKPTAAVIHPSKIIFFEPYRTLIPSPKKRPKAMVKEKAKYPIPIKLSLAIETFLRYKALQSIIAPSAAIIKKPIIINPPNGKKYFKLNGMGSIFLELVLK